MTEGYEKRKEIAFNAGMFHAYYVAGLMNKASDNYGRDLNDMYTYLQKARDRMHADLKPEEVDKLNYMERKIVYLRNKHLKSRTRQDYNTTKEKYVMALREFLQEIMNCMRLAGYLPTKRDRARLGF